MDKGGEHPVEILWRMQREAMASGNMLPEEIQDEPRWGGLAFAIGEFKIVTELTSVIDVLTAPALTPIPGTKPWLKGICNVRGSLYSVVDVGFYLEVAPPVADGEGRLLVLNDKDLGCTLLVPTVFGLRYFVEEQQRQEISTLDPALQPYAEQAFLQDGETWAALDLGRLIATAKFMGIESGA